MGTLFVTLLGSSVLILNCIEKDIVCHGFRVLRVRVDDPLRMEIFPENTFFNKFPECRDFLRHWGHLIVFFSFFFLFL